MIDSAMSAQKPSRHILSKSTFIRGCQCHKSLYLYKHSYKSRDPLTPAQRAVFNRGTNVGVLARRLFPGGVDASPPTPFQFQRSVARTREEVDSGTEVVYEAAFNHLGVLAAMDILVKEDDPPLGSRGSVYRAYEVKSSTGISETYLLDAALQYWVISGSGIELSDISIVHIDTGYVRRGDLELDRLFRTQSVLAEVLQRQEFIANKVEELKALIGEPEVPEIEIGPQCNDPYPCDFIGTCWKDVPEYSVFDLSRLSEERKFELFRSGVVEVGAVPDDFPLSEKQRIQVEVERSGTALIDHAALEDFLDRLQYPLYFVDFESFQPAVPLYDDSRPYQQIPFQYSLHVAESAEGVLRHEEFLAEAGPDPRRPFLEALLAALDSSGSVLVYNRTFEETRLAELTDEFIEYRAEISGIQARILDLMLPFRNQSYYTPQMRGSYSIKRVLPALAPELSYDGLAIQDGTQASIAYERLLRETDARAIGRVRRRLLEYCKMDTLAMVKILHVLGREVGRSVVADPGDGR